MHDFLLTHLLTQTSSMYDHLYTEKAKPKRRASCPGHTASGEQNWARIYDFWLSSPSSFYHITYLFAWLKSLVFFLEVVWSHWILELQGSSRMGAVLLYKVGLSLLLLPNWLVLFQRHLLFHLWVMKSLPHTINPSLTFSCSCVNWQLWITSAVKMPEGLVPSNHISWRRPAIADGCINVPVLRQRSLHPAWRLQRQIQRRWRGVTPGGSWFMSEDWTCPCIKSKLCSIKPEPH